MSLTEQQACRILEVTPATLKMFVATHRLGVTRKRTIRGVLVSYATAEVAALKREIQKDEEHFRTHYERERASSDSFEPELVENENGAAKHNGRNSFVPASTPVLERLLLLLEALTPSEHPKVAIERKLLLTLPEAAAYSGLSEVKLNQAVRSGKLKARKDLGKGYRIKRSDIEAFVKSL
jgi:excisionase family DNA binding protein